MGRRTSATAPKLDQSGIAVLRTAGSVYDIINQSIHAAGLQADITKCEFNVTETKFLWLDLVDGP